MQYLQEIIDYGIIGILLFMSFLAIAIFFERVFYLKRVDINSFKTKELLENDLTNNITIIATIASNAPYIGLLGTVLAIMQTFVDMSKQDLAATKIMASLALALKTTAVGLLVAIISVILYNILARNIETKLAHYGN